MAVFRCCAGRLRYVPQAPLRSFCDASGGCVSLRSTARPFAAPLHFAPPEAQARHLSIAIVLYAPRLPPTSRHEKNTHGTPLWIVFVIPFLNDRLSLVKTRL